jgi:cellulose synthase/poly-beta-1,6-N-acetylglucosamine synthase-like glycosyltransferase
MVSRTLCALSRLDYERYEVIIVDNNTQDELLWRPVEMMCRKLGSRFRFFHLETWPGFKAGALNYALAKTSAVADLVCVIDSDYEVLPALLEHVVPYFANPSVGFVQTPQDYRGQEESAFAEACYWEYQQFFAVGMMLRDKRNAILLHGTMSVVRRNALEELGGWGEWCMTEDSELGLRLLACGYIGQYVPQTMGRGLLPLSYRSYRRQRRRWVIGGVQTLRRHWKLLVGLPSAADRLTLAQRLHYCQGWVPWLRDAFVVVSMALGLFLGFAALGGASTLRPLMALGVGIAIVLFHFAVRHTLIYRWQLSCSWRQTLAAMTAILGLTPTIGLGWLEGCLRRDFAFQRTPKSPSMEGLARYPFGYGALVSASAMATLGALLLVAFGGEALIAAATLGAFAAILIASSRMDHLARSCRGKAFHYEVTTPPMPTCLVCPDAANRIRASGESSATNNDQPLTSFHPTATG